MEPRRPLELLRSHTPEIQIVTLGRAPDHLPIVWTTVVTCESLYASMTSRMYGTRAVRHRPG